VNTIKYPVQGPYEGHIVADLSHLLRPDPNHIGPRGYPRAIRQPVSPTAVRLIAAWITAHWGRTGAETV
jgi:uncharacterized protein